jgi:hypothetical protein
LASANALAKPKTPTAMAPIPKAFPALPDFEPEEFARVDAMRATPVEAPRAIVVAERRATFLAKTRRRDMILVGEVGQGALPFATVASQFHPAFHVLPSHTTLSVFMTLFSADLREKTFVVGVEKW